MKKIVFLLALSLITSFVFSQSTQLVGKTLKLTSTSSVVIDGIIPDMSSFLNSNAKLPTAKAVSDRINSVADTKHPLMTLVGNGVNLTGNFPSLSNLTQNTVITSPGYDYSLGVDVFSTSTNSISFTNYNNRYNLFMSPSFSRINHVNGNQSSEIFMETSGGSQTQVSLKSQVDFTNFVEGRFISEERQFYIRSRFSDGYSSDFLFGNNTNRTRAFDFVKRLNTSSAMSLFGIDTSGNIYSNTLVGTGDRMVVASAGGILSTQPIPSGGGGGSVVTAMLYNRATRTITLEQTSGGSKTVSLNDTAYTFENSPFVSGSNNLMYPFNDSTARFRRIKFNTGLDTTGSTADLLNVTATAGDWNTITNKPATFTPSTHTHAIADVIGLQADLNNKPNLNTQNLFSAEQRFNQSGTPLYIGTGVNGYDAIKWPANNSQISLIGGGSIGLYQSGTLAASFGTSNSRISSLGGFGDKLVKTNNLGELSTYEIPILDSSFVRTFTSNSSTTVNVDTLFIAANSTVIYEISLVSSFTANPTSSTIEYCKKRVILTSSSTTGYSVTVNSLETVDNVSGCNYTVSIISNLPVLTATGTSSEIKWTFNIKPVAYHTHILP
jgi:hypothetical protein